MDGICGDERKTDTLITESTKVHKKKRKKKKWTTAAAATAADDITVTDATQFGLLVHLHQRFTQST